MPVRLLTTRPREFPATVPPTVEARAGLIQRLVARRALAPGLLQSKSLVLRRLGMAPDGVRKVP